MNYDTFRTAFDAALRQSGLRICGVRPDERLDLARLDRTYRVAVEPIGGQDAEPFFVTALLSWRWDALHTARTLSTEDDVLAELHGRHPDGPVRTEPPWVRLDIELRATLPYGKPLALPSQAALGRWCHEACTRLEHIEPLTGPEPVRQHEDGGLAVLAWQDAEPRIRASCRSSGELMLERVEIAAWQAIPTPRILDDPSADPDPGPHEELNAAFSRTRAALTAWTQALDHLRATARTRVNR